TNLVVMVAVAFVPMLCFSALWAQQDATGSRSRRIAAIIAGAEISASGHRQILEGSRRLLLSACAEDAVRKSADPAPDPSDVASCEAYLGRLMQKFSAEYSAAIVTDASGEVRCASAP